MGAGTSAYPYHYVRRGGWGKSSSFVSMGTGTSACPYHQEFANRKDIYYNIPEREKLTKLIKLGEMEIKMEERATPQGPPGPLPTWDLVLKRNSRERMKKEKAPLKILDELPQLIEKGYEALPEEDIVRLQWYGLYHDKPKVGYFMLRVKIPNGWLTPSQFRTIGELSVRYGRSFAELTTRQNVQLHWIRLEDLPEVFDVLWKAGLSTTGGCGDTVRNITGCPVAGIDSEEIFDTSAIVREAATFFYGHPDYSDLPRKHKITISACPYQCNAPDFHCIAFIGVRKGDREGFAVKIGGGLSSAPRLSRDLGVFVPVEATIPVLRAIIDVWQNNLRYRLSFVKARLKFMVDDYGPEAYRRMVEEHLGYRLEDYPAPLPKGETDHLGIHPQKQEGFYYIGFPVPIGVVTGEQIQRIADVAEEVGGDLRLTRQQNFILGNIPEEKLDWVVRSVGEIGFPLHINRIWGRSVACTGQPLCNYAVTETKYKLKSLVEHLERVFGEEASLVKVHLDGCPNACGQHWVGDIGLQGTTARETDEAGNKLQAFDIFLRGGLGLYSNIGRPLVRRVPTYAVEETVERLVGAYLRERREGDSFQDFCARHTDEELVAIATGQPVEAVVSATAERSKGGVHK